MRRTLAVAALALGLILTGCGSGGAGDSGTEAPSSSDGGGMYGDGGGSTSASELKLADTDLGEIVVTGDGMTAYMFDTDTQGADTSACTGACLQNWPPIIATGDTPKGDGVTGELGTIKTADGKMQVTLNGWPLYLFAGDTKAGDTNGQGVKDVWWVVDAAGEKIGG
ncbi:hypothetical protein [Microbacterium sp. H1-D42]|uniref:COG4315 family predicted lipoprotein n=1 Tax=Microbacterium sp. H1-D42 TaxID=2925844 RepID=UPI001F5315FE|nr:hypothetical protein [Microbacterium sp. H1-D42]UNK69861.1 hypothetical protein MNR00_11855 [Microbacterium sp. H1-D42]